MPLRLVLLGSLDAFELKPQLAEPVPTHSSITEEHASVSLQRAKKKKQSKNKLVWCCFLKDTDHALYVD